MLPAARRILGRWSVGKVITENGGHGCRRLTGWDGKEASLIAIGTRAGMPGFRRQALLRAKTFWSLVYENSTISLADTRRGEIRVLVIGSCVFVP